MDISRFIKNHKELNELPFLIVFRTLCVLQNMKVLNIAAEVQDVETSQREPVK